MDNQSTVQSLATLKKHEAEKGHSHIKKIVIQTHDPSI